MSLSWQIYLKQIKERMEKISPAPWYVEDYRTKGDWRSTGLVWSKGDFPPGHLICSMDVRKLHSNSESKIIETFEANAEFISESRTDIEKLVARVEELTEALNDIRRETCGFVELKKLSGPIIQLQKIYQITLIADPCKKVLSKEVPNA